MTAAPRTPRQMARVLLAAVDESLALALVRRGTNGLRQETARLLEQDFNRLILTSRAGAEAAARAAAAIAVVDRGDVARARAWRMAGILDHLAGRPRVAVRRLALAAVAFQKTRMCLEAGDVHRTLVDVHMRAGNDRDARSAARRALSCYRRA